MPTRTTSTRSGCASAPPSPPPWSTTATRARCWRRRAAATTAARSRRSIAGWRRTAERRGPRSLLREEPAQAELELAADQVQEAVELVFRQRQRTLQPSQRLLQHALAGRLQPARRGGAV